MKKLLKSKTFWASIVAIITAFVSWATGEITFAQFIMAFVGGFVAIFIRDGIDQHLQEFFGKWKFWTSKTFWAGVAGALGSLTAWLTGSIELGPALLGIVSSLIAIFIRSAVEPEGP